MNIFRFMKDHKLFTFIVFIQFMTYLYAIDYLRFHQFHTYLFVVVPLLFTYIFDSFYQLVLWKDETINRYLDEKIIKLMNSCILIMFILIYTISLISFPINPLFFKFTIMNIILSILGVFIMFYFMIKSFTFYFSSNTDSDAPPDDAK